MGRRDRVKMNQALGKKNEKGHSFHFNGSDSLRVRDIIDNVTIIKIHLFYINLLPFWNTGDGVWLTLGIL